MRRLIVAEPVARSAVWARRLSLFALAIAGVAIALSRMHAVAPSAALTVFGAALVVAAFALGLAVSAAVLIWRDGLRGAQQAALGFVLAAALVAYPIYLAAVAFLLPPINDVSTDLKSPPPFLLSAKAREARGGAEPLPPSDETRAAQRAAYPDLATVRVPMDSTGAYQLALNIASDLGWSREAADRRNLGGDGAALIEATARSLFFEFISDIAIRIRPGAVETAIDLRSVSRVGRHDFGANARRVRRFIADAQETAREE